MQSTKHSLFVRPLANSHSKQASKRDSKQADRPDFNKENVYPYFNNGQVSMRDPYHADITDSNKENVRDKLSSSYFDCGVTVPSNPYGLLISPPAAGDDAIISPPTDSFPQNSHPASSLDIYRQRDLLNRPGKAVVNLSPMTLRPRSSTGHPVAFLKENHQSDLLKRSRTDSTDSPAKTKSHRLENDSSVSSLKETDQTKSLKRSKIDDEVSSIKTKYSRHQDTDSVSSLKKSQPVSTKTPKTVRNASERGGKPRRCSEGPKKNHANSCDKKGSGFRPSGLLSRNTGRKDGYVPGIMSSPITKGRLKEEFGSPLKPIFNEYGSPTKAQTRDGDILVRSIKSQLIHTYTANATEPDLCNFDETNALTDIEPTFTPRARLEGFVILDTKLLDDFYGVRKHWPTNQRSVMGMRAADALSAAGVDVEGVECHIMHNIAHSMGGLDGEEPNAIENFTNGTAGENGRHLRWEDSIKALVRKHGPLYVRYAFNPNQSEYEKK